jgi:hypothetical protein
MRIAIMTVMAIGLLTMPALAQSVLPPNAPPGHSLPGMEKATAPAEHPTVKADEKAYKSALDGIQPKQSLDPWGNVREKPKATNSR